MHSYHWTSCMGKVNRKRHQSQNLLKTRSTHWSKPMSWYERSSPCNMRGEKLSKTRNTWQPLRKRKPGLATFPAVWSWRVHKKVHHVWKGLFQVLERISNSDYCIKGLGRNKPVQIVQFDRLKPCTPLDS